jgi:hypothetical protein
MGTSYTKKVCSAKGIWNPDILRAIFMYLIDYPLY